MPKGAPIMFSKFSFISRNINVHIVIKQMKLMRRKKKKKKDERKLLYGEPELEKRRRGW